MNDKHIRKEHNVSLILYHFVCPVKYRKKVLSTEISESLVSICKWIEERYEIRFEEIWTDEDHVHFLIQWIPMDSPKKIIQLVKSITAKEMLVRHPELKKLLRWSKFRTRWYYVNTVWMYASFETIKNYVKNQWWDKYEKLYDNWYKMTSLFGGQVY